MFDFDSMPSWLRWVGFIPALGISALMAYILINIGFETLSKYVTNEMIFYVIGRILFNLIGIYFCLISSVSVIPKGKIVLAAVYLSLILMLSTFSLTSYLLLNNGPYLLWQIIYECTLSIAAAVVVLVQTILWVKKQKLDSEKVTLSY